MQATLPEQYLTEVEQFQAELLNFNITLPKSFAFSERSLLLQTYSSVRKSIIMLKVWWQQIFIDLHRGFFPSIREGFRREAMQTISLDNIASYRKKCLQNALNLSEAFILIQQLDSSDGFVVSDSSLAICAYQCSKILYQAGRMGLDRDVRPRVDIFDNMKACAGVLEELKEVFPHVAAIVSHCSFRVAIPN